MVQRRRGVHDTLSSMFIRLDNRQELFEEFATGFNAIEADFRFDPECCAELHLRSLEFREAILTICDVRRKEAYDYLTRAAADGAVELSIHVCESEAAAFLQAEYNRFHVALHVLFDYTKMVAGFDMGKRGWNNLEETLPPVLPPLPFPTPEASSAAGLLAKDAGKGAVKPGGGTSVDSKAGSKTDPKKIAGKGKGVVEEDIPPAPYRDPIPPIAMPTAVMETLPVPIPVVGMCMCVLSCYTL